MTVFCGPPQQHWRLRSLHPFASVERDIGHWRSGGNQCQKVIRTPPPLVYHHPMSSPCKETARRGLPHIRGGKHGYSQQPEYGAVAHPEVPMFV